MAPARSVTASVVALGFAGTLTAPLPALAAPGCERPERYAAQSGAELLRIDRLDLSPSARIADSPPAGTDDEGASFVPPSHLGETFLEESAGVAPQKVVGDVGLGNTRSVLIAGAPVSSAGAARVLQGKVAGTTARNELAVQQAPPTRPRGSERKTSARQYGPVSIGTGALHARAVWAPAMNCGAGEREVSSASAEISRITITGGGNGALIRVPEKISSRSGTALRQRAGTSQTVATATITAGQFSLVDNEVRLRVLRAPLLTVSAGGKGRVDYRPAIVEVTSRGGKTARLDTAGDHIDITLSDELRPLESDPKPLVPIGGLPVPTVPGLPALTETENSPVPTGTNGSMLRISLGAVRQATDGQAIAAAATAIRVTVARDDDTSDSKPSGVVADLGIGMLQAAAVAPVPGTGTGTGVRPGSGAGARPGSGSGAGVGSDSGTGAGIGPGFGSDSGVASDSGLPITGPRVLSLVLAGVTLVIGGLGAVALTSRRRRRRES